MSGPEFPIRGAVVGAMATFPARFDTLERVVDSLMDQLDYLFVYVNQAESVPTALKRRRVIPLLGCELDGDLSATGKIYPLRLVEDCTIFTLDDDFIYPADYVRGMCDAIDRWGPVAATVHGSIFSPGAEWYFERSRIFGARSPLARDRLVALPGSGTFAFRQSTLRLAYEDFPRVPMVDLQFAIAARQQRVPIVAVRRPEGWLTFLEREGLWEQNRARITHHTLAMQAHAPWDFESYRAIYCDVLRPHLDACPRKDAEQDLCDPDAMLALRTGGTPPDWCRTVDSVRTRQSYLDVAVA